MIRKKKEKYTDKLVEKKRLDATHLRSKQRSLAICLQQSRCVTHSLTVVPLKMDQIDLDRLPMDKSLHESVKREYRKRRSLATTREEKTPI